MVRYSRLKHPFACGQLVHHCAAARALACRHGIPRGQPSRPRPQRDTPMPLPEPHPASLPLWSGRAAAHRLRGGVSGRFALKLNLCFSVGFRMRKEHMSDSSTDITCERRGGCRSAGVGGGVGGGVNVSWGGGVMGGEE